MVSLTIGKRVLIWDYKRRSFVSTGRLHGRTSSLWMLVMLPLTVTLFAGSIFWSVLALMRGVGALLGTVFQAVIAAVVATAEWVAGATAATGNGIADLAYLYAHSGAGIIVIPMIGVLVFCALGIVLEVLIDGF